ncbi:MAG: hypothetical protein E2604_17755, partial [Flavobacterium sp.]|nr:hypothetical protein [Flavobacterium sp.]
HIGGVGLQAISANLLPPPDGGNASISDLQQTLHSTFEYSISSFNSLLHFSHLGCCTLLLFLLRLPIQLLQLRVYIFWG